MRINYQSRRTRYHCGLSKVQLWARLGPLRRTATQGPISRQLWTHADVEFNPADSYTIVVSTFRPGDEGSFQVVFGSNLPLQVTPIVQEGGGLFNRTAKGSW